jgi:hypothetical protein
MKRQQLEFTQYISPDGLIYDFNNKVDKFLYPIDKLGMSPIRYITQRGPFQHGETMLNYFLEPRLVQVRHRRLARSRDGQWDIRNDIIDYIRPNRQAANSLEHGILRKTFPDGRVRDLSVLVQVGPMFTNKQGSWDQWAIDDVIRFIAHDPTFFDPDPVVAAFGFASFDELSFPIDFPVEFFSSTLDETSSFTYSGTWLSYPTITVVGPLSGMIITNSSIDKKIELDYQIKSGETVTINTEYGNKTVVNQDDTNLIGTLTTDSDLDTFHIAPAPVATGGINTIRVQGSEANPDETSILFSYYTRYIGI